MSETPVSGIEYQIERISLIKIKRDGGTQSRAKLDVPTVHEYAEAMQNGDKFPPVEMIYDGEWYHVWDGFHRLAAIEALPHNTEDEIEAHVRQGTRRDAILLAAGANAKHGLPRSNADKRRAVETLLQDDEWRIWSDRKIADMTNTRHPFVGKIRAELYPAGLPDERKVERNGQAYTMSTATINADRPYTPTNDDRNRIKAALADGPLHRSILERRSLLQTRAFAATIQLMQDAGEVLRHSLIYRLPDLPETTKTSQNADLIYNYLVEIGAPVRAVQAANALKMDSTDFVRAANLLEAMQRAERQKGVAGISMLAAILPTDDNAPDPSVDESDAIDDQIIAAVPPADELSAHFDHDAITILGRSDQGAWHRAIEIGRKLVAAGLWDGQTPIEFDAYELHDKLFGVNRVEPTASDFQAAGTAPAGDVLFEVILDIMDGADGLTAQQIATLVKVRTGQTILEDALITTMNALVVANDVVILDFDGDDAMPRYALYATPTNYITDRVLSVLRQASEPLFMFQINQQSEVRNMPTTTIAVDDLVKDGAVEVVPGEYKGQNHRYQIAADGPAAEETTDPEPPQEPAHDDQPRRGLPVTVDTARELIIDALRKSQRPLGRGELLKYAGIADEHIAAGNQAFEAMIAAGTIIGTYAPNTGRRYHFPDMFTVFADEEGILPANNDDSPAPNAEDDLVPLESALHDLEDQQRAVLCLAVPDFAALDDPRRQQTYELLRDVLAVNKKLQAHLVDLLAATGRSFESVTA